MCEAQNVKNVMPVPMFGILTRVNKWLYLKEIQNKGVIHAISGFGDNLLSAH
jgi:hypothetical protein